MEAYKRSPLLKRLAVIACIAIFISCNNKSKLAEIDPAFSKFIDAYTSGVVSKKNTIRIQLATEAATTHTLNEPLKETLFEFFVTYY
jgi:hypothetical protein